MLQGDAIFFPHEDKETSVKYIKFAQQLELVYLRITLLFISFLSQENNIGKLCSGIVAKTEELCPSLVSQATEISTKCNELFQLFAICHFLYDSADYLSDERINKLGENISLINSFLLKTTFMQRNNFY